MNEAPKTTSDNGAGLGPMVCSDDWRYAYAVYHPDAEDPAPIFKTWEEALAKQVEWNRAVPGHKAKRRIL